MQSNNFFYLDQVIDRQPLIVLPETSLNDVIQQMQEWGNIYNLKETNKNTKTNFTTRINNSCALIVERERLKGVFTERNLVELIAAGRDLAKLTVGEVMSRELITLTSTGTEDIFTALNLMHQHRIRHLPVIDESDRLLGLITEKDLRQNLQPINLMRWRRVKEIMETNVIHALPSISIRQAARLMANHQVSYVAIVEQDNAADELVIPVGIITERDIVQFQTLNLDLAQPVRNLMSTPLFLVDPEDSLWKVHQLMQQHRVRRLLVAGSRGELRGIITQTSLLQVFEPTEMYGIIEQLHYQVCQLEIERAEYLQALTTELEDEVQERTSGLTIANQQLQQEIVKRHEALRDRQLAESQLRIQARQQRAIAELGQYALREKNLVLLMERAVNLVASILKVEYCQVLELLPDRKTLLLKAGVGWRDGLVGVATVKAEGNSQAGYTLLSSEPVVVTDLLAENRFSTLNLLLDHQGKSSMSVVISGNDRSWGILGTHSTRQRIFSQDDINFMQTTANILAQAIERQQAELALLQSEQKFRAIFDRAFQFIGLLEPNGNIIEANQTALDFVGLTSADVVGKPFWETPWWSMSVEIQQGLKQAIKQAARGNFIRYEVDHLGVDGQVTVDFSLTPVKDEKGRVVMLIPEGRNITNHKQVETNLQKSNQLLQAISLIQTQFLADTEPQILFDGMLDRVLELTESEYGFIGEILWTADGSPRMEESYMKVRGQPYLKTHAITNIAWNEATRAFYAENAPKGMEFHNLQTLFGAVMVTGKPVIANSPSTDPRRGGLPDGHPPLNAFLGVPFYKENEMTGMVGIANREGGYYEAIVDYLQPFLATCSRIIEAYRSDRQKQQAEQKIIQQATLLDVATDAIMVRDLNNQILFWNQGAENLYGWTKTEALNRNANELLYREPFTELSEIQQIVTEKGKWQGELKQKTKASKDIVVQSRWTLVKDRTKNPHSYLVVNTDITEKKQLEDQFLRIQRLESLGTLAGGIAHDLNNILAPILGFAQLLPRKLPDVDERTLKIFKMIETNAKRGTALVNQILTFSRGLESDRGSIQIRHLLAEIRQIIRETFPKTIELEMDLSRNLWTIDADATQIHQVLMNLALNARDAMPHGGTLIITAENFPIDANFARLHIEAHEGPYVLVTFADTGVGIPPVMLDKIFEPFFTTKEVGRGTGLGLSTAIGIIKNHGGFIDVYSEVERGTEFKVFLPACEAAEELSQEEELPQGKGELILVVDDEIQICEVTKATLETFNYRVLTAHNGIDAIAIYAKHQNEIEVVLTDIMMPSMNGKTLIRTIKKINPQIDIIVFSGLISNREIITELDGSIAAFINKPYTTEALLKTIHQAIGDRTKSF